MLKKLQVIFLLVMWLSTGLFAQEVVLSDEFDDGDGLWNTGWIDDANVTVTFSIDTNSVLSGKNSYKADVVDGDAGDGALWHIQRVSALPLKAGYIYELSFMAVANQDNAALQVLFELGGDPYTKRLDETPTISTTPQTFTYTVSATENVADNFVKLMFGGAQNNNTTIWVDAVTVTEMPDPTLVSQWGLADYKSWPILNDSTTGAGDGSISGEVMSGWRSLQGGFDDVKITTDKALVVMGKLEFAGGAVAADAYTPIRYAISYQDSSPVLKNALTDSAAWSRTGNHFGYSFMPRTGNGTVSNGGGGIGTTWLINNGNWASTWSNNGYPIANVNQAPRNADMVEGVYDFAISVIAIDDTTNEISWYMVEENNAYWFGGTVRDTAVTTKFNRITFGVDEFEGTAFNLMGVRAQLGDPITVPEAPWEAYYVDQWGLADYKSWPILNDSTTLVGDASISGEVMSGWRSLQGGFGQDVTISTDKAIIVEGQIEFAGGAVAADAYTPIRYAISYQDSSPVLENALTDSAAWSRTGNHYGYSFMPRTGNGTVSNGGGGIGTTWLINNGNWASTWSNNGYPIANVNQAPRNADMVAGVYDFAISVQVIDDTTNEIRWYMVEENNAYWFGGIVRDTAVTTKFNRITFGVDQFEGTAFNVIAMKVDKGDPIDVPEAPWQAYYVDQWGLADYKSWPILNDSTTLVGDASISGEVMSGWRSLQGGFGQDVTISTDKAIIVEGQIEFAGGAPSADAYTPIRYAISYQDSSPVLENALTDSAAWSRTGNHYGYSFMPRTGNGTVSNGGGGIGTNWIINNGNWASTWSNNGYPIANVNQAPRNADMVEGVYDFAISVQAIDDTTNEIRWYMVEENMQYWFGGIVRDTAVTTKFNRITFGVDGYEGTAFNVIAMRVDKGDPIDVIKAPWEDFYVDTWGIYGDKNGGWTLSEGEFTGNVDYNGTAAPTDWAVVRGDLGSINPEPDVDIFVLEGSIELVGGGFNGSSNLRFGLFNGDAGSVAIDSVLDSSYVWTGADDNNTGYLMLATENSETWGQGSGNWGKITNDAWYNFAGGMALGDKAPLETSTEAGTYDFKICVAPYSDGTTNVIWTLEKSDGSFYMDGGVKDNAPITSFNSFVVGLSSGASATSMYLRDVQATMSDELIPSDIEDLKSALPTKFALNQNYPNPFNPSTTIEFAIPKNSEVKIAVYDILGRLVTELVNSEYNAGYYKVNFNAANYASGVYYYQIKAGDFVNTKKLILLK